MSISHFMRFPVESHLKMGYEIGNLSTEQVGKRKKKTNAGIQNVEK